MFGKLSQAHSWMYIACIAAFSHQFFVVVEAVKGKVYPNESKSSPSQITAMKNSSVWFHWNYTYEGDFDTVAVYQYQSIIYKRRYASTPVELARRASQHAALEKSSPISDPIGTRIDVISVNSTLVVNNLQYNDSGSNLSSSVQLKSAQGPSYPVDLLPVVTLHVIGAPEFKLLPPTAISVSENSKLEIKVQMDGSPKPSTTFQWPHNSSKDTSVAGTEPYRYIFESIYTLNNIPASYCGRIVDTKIQNNVGAATKKTNVTVLLKLDADPTLQAGKPRTGCVNVKWNQAESGACFVKYSVQFKNTSGVVTTKVVYNTGWMTQCFVPVTVNITNVQLNISFKTTTKTFTAKVSESPIPTTPAPTVKATTPGGRGGGGGSESNTGAIIGGVVGGVVLLVIIAVLIYCKKKSSSKNDEEHDQGETGFQMNTGNEYSVVHRKNSSEEPEERINPNPVYDSANSSTLIYATPIRGPNNKPHKAKPRESDYAEVKVDKNGYPAVGAFPHSDTEGYVGRSNTGGHNRERDGGRRVAPERRPPPPYNDRRSNDELVQENPLYESADIGHDR